MNTLRLPKAVFAGWVAVHAPWRKLASTVMLALSMLATMCALAPARADELLSPPQLEQLVAPVALYPDSLLSQVLMASTYPLEVVEAQRWRAAQPKRMSDQQLSAAVQGQPWDPSVKSLTAFPDVLLMMSDKIDWTQQLGDAFLGQQQDVMDAVQRLRARAEAAGHLKSGSQQRVVVSDDSPAIIQIVPAQPDIVYVPTYNPLVVYGPWPYPAYRPIYWYPPAYYPAPGVFISFGAGLIVGNALWGHVDWHRHYVNINVNRYNHFNRAHITSNRWEHNVQHRRGVEYRDRGARQRFGPGGPSGMRATEREQFRNRADAGRRQLNDPGHRQAAQRAIEHGQNGAARGNGLATPNLSSPQRGARNNGGFGGNGRDLRTPNTNNHRAPAGQAPANINRTPRPDAGHNRSATPFRNISQPPPARARETPQRPAAQHREAPRQSGSGLMESRHPGGGGRSSGERGGHRGGDR